MTANNKNSSNNQTTKCPFVPLEGYTTAKVYQEFAKNYPTMADPTVDISSNDNFLKANLDPNQPLYIWQLYSILGKEPIVKLITDFYTRVFADKDEPWFRDAFRRLAPLDHHIAAQAAYWMDAFGGGRRYHGGEFRLRFHHEHNVAEIMTAAGAKRWMYHMRASLEQAQFNDPRVKPCILDFLSMKMKSYADQFEWEFNENDMELYQDG